MTELLDCLKISFFLFGGGLEKYTVGYITGDLCKYKTVQSVGQRFLSGDGVTLPKVCVLFHLQKYIDCRVVHTVRRCQRLSLKQPYKADV